MSVTTIGNMQIVPEKFSEYVIDRTTQLNTFINSGIATPDATVAQIINGTPEGGRFIQLPMWNELDGEDDVFGENDVTIGDITTKEARATLLMRHRAWGSTDLARVMGGADPMGAVAQLIADWRNSREQKVYLAILKGIFTSSTGALVSHVNDISGLTGNSGEDAYISDAATLDTKQLLGDHYNALGMVFMHSATYTYLQKKGMITRNPIFDPSQSSVDMERYLGYQIKVDDGMPVQRYIECESTATGALEVVADTATPTSSQIKISTVKAGGLDAIEVGDYVVTTAIYDTYFIGKGAFIRQEGMPQGFIGTETDRDKIGAKNYLINRWCQVIHPRGMSWVSTGTYTNTANKYPANVDLSLASNWGLVVDHKKVALACLRHKIG